MQQIDRHIQDAIHAFNGDRPSRSATASLQQAPLLKAPPAACETPTESPLKSTKIADNVLAILRAGTVEGNLFRLAPDRLDPNIYKAVNAVLKDLGGKWKSGKTQAHVFEEGTDRLDLAIATGRFLSNKDLGFFPTPDDVVEDLFKIASILPGQRLLEPSAGMGGLAKKAADIVGQNNVHCVEIEPARANQLRLMGFPHVITGDFLKMDPDPIYDGVLMNPPFGRGLEFLHVEHAMKFVKPGGTVTAIVSPHYLVSNYAAAKSFREKVEAACVNRVEVDPGRFKASGTIIATYILCLEVDRWPGLDRQASDVIHAPAAPLKKGLAANPV
jgi:predicted RNA methylase